MKQQLVLITTLFFATTLSAQKANNSYNSVKSNSAGMKAVDLSVDKQQVARPTNNPVPGIDVIVRKKPGGQAMSAGKTDENGNITTKLDEGNYTVTLGETKVKNPRITVTLTCGDGTKGNSFSFDALQTHTKRRPEFTVKSGGSVTISVNEPGVK